MSQPNVMQWLQVGDLRRAAAALVESYGSDVLATCLAMLRDRASAEDVTQEVFGEAMRGLSTFRGESSPRTWLLSIARNRCIDALRARKRDPWAGAPPDEEGANPDAHADEGALGSEWLADRSVVARALEVLSEGERALVVLRFKNGLEYGELAAAFGLREGTVRMRVSRALARMRQVLEEDGNAQVARLRAPAAPAPMAPARPAAAFAPALSSRAMPASPAMGTAGGAFGGGPPQTRGAPFVAWAARSPRGNLGMALASVESSMPSERLTARLGAMVEGLA